MSCNWFALYKLHQAFALENDRHNRETCNFRKGFSQWLIRPRQTIRHALKLEIDVNCDDAHKICNVNVRVYETKPLCKSF